MQITRYLNDEYLIMSMISRHVETPTLRIRREKFFSDITVLHYCMVTRFPTYFKVSETFYFSMYACVCEWWYTTFGERFSVILIMQRQRLRKS